MSLLWYVAADSSRAAARQYVIKYFKHMLRSVGFGISNWENGNFGELGDNEKEAVVDTNEIGADPRD